jgi:hypothetical protein
MAESAEARAKAVITASEGVKELDAAAQQAAIEAVVPPPGEKTTGTLWIIAVGGLIGLLVIALIGLLFLIADDKKPDLALTAFSALLAGFLGLFVPSPVKKGGGQ